MGVLAASDPVVNLLGGGLVVLGIALFVATVAYWRSSVPDKEVLAPLEVMSDRRFARADDVERADILDEYRPDGISQHDDLRPFAVAADANVDPSSPRWVDNRDRYERAAATAPEFAGDEYESDDDEAEHEAPSDVWRHRDAHVIPDEQDVDEAYAEDDFDDEEFDDDNERDDNEEAEGDYPSEPPAFIDPLINLQNQQRRD